MISCPTFEQYRDTVDTLLSKLPIGEEKLSLHTKRAIWQEAAQEGLFRAAGPIAFGGYGNRHYSLLLMEELGRRHILDIPFWLQCDVILYLFQYYASDCQRNHYLPHLLSGSSIFSFALTEEHGGSDLASITTQVESKDTYLLLNGRKKYITNASISDVILVLAKGPGPSPSDSCIVIVDKNVPGVDVSPIDNITMPALDIGEVTFCNVKLKPDTLLGDLHNVSLVVQGTLSIERMANAVLCHELAQSLLVAGYQWASSRRKHDQSLLAHQYIQYSFAEYHANARVLHAYLDRLKARYRDGKRIAVEDAAIAKYKTNQYLTQLSTFLAKLFGARIIASDSDVPPVLRILNEAIAHSIAGGTEETMKRIIFQCMSY
jgi:acyl-CoA dehydrogenase